MGSLLLFLERFTLADKFGNVICDSWRKKKQRNSDPGGWFSGCPVLGWAGTQKNNRVQLHLQLQDLMWSSNSCIMVGAFMHGISQGISPKVLSFTVSSLFCCLIGDAGIVLVMWWTLIGCDWSDFCITLYLYYSYRMINSQRYWIGINAQRYWIYTLIITTYCMNKRGFHCAPLHAVFSLILFFPYLHSSLFFSSILSRLIAHYNEHWTYGTYMGWRAVNTANSRNFISRWLFMIP